MTVKKYNIIILSSLVILFSAQTVGAQTLFLPELPSRFRLQAENNAKNFANQIQERRERVNGEIISRNNQANILALIKDPTKRQKAEEINQQIQYVNLSWTNYYIDALAKLDLVLAKIKSRTEKERLNGYDSEKVEKAISKADRAIVTAREALVIEVSKNYLLNPDKIRSFSATSDTRTQFKQTRDNLLLSFMNFRDNQMAVARQQVLEVLQLLLQDFPAQ